MKKLQIVPETVVLAVSYVAMVAFNALGEIFKLGGVTSADVSNEVFAWFAPAGYVFMIWSVIYVGLAVWGVRLALDEGHERHLAGLPVGVECALFVLSCVLNIAWLTFWHLKVFAATIPVIVALLVTVAALYVLTWRRSSSPLDRVPPALYASWLTVATMANVAHVLERSGLVGTGFVPAALTLVLLAVLLVASYVVRRVFDEYAFGLVVAWAGIGIGVRLTGVSAPFGVLVIVASVLGVAASYVPWGRVLPALRKRG